MAVAIRLEHPLYRYRWPGWTWEGIAHHEGSGVHSGARRRYQRCGQSRQHHIGDENAEIYVMTTDGQNLTKHPGGDFDPDWR